MNRVTRLLAFAALDGLFLAVAFLGGYYTHALSGEHPFLRLPLPGAASDDTYPLLGEIRGLLRARYIGPLPDGKTLEHGAARGLVGAINDPYTVFIEPQSAELQTQELQGEYGGIGVGLTKKDTGEIVLSPYPDSPAAKAGLLEGDALLAVDAKTLTTTTTLDEATALIRGPINTPVTVKVRHLSTEELTATITRQRIQIPSVMWKIVDGQPTIGLIAVSRFSDKSADEVQHAADDLRSKGATRFILDLRNNGGGILESGVDVAAKFLDGGVVMYETQRNAPEKTYTAPSNAGPLASAPLVVLVNHNTASAAEIVAGALLDRGRAPLVGQTTFGKGSVQLVYDLSDGSSLHVTAYLWYTPARRALDKSGLLPTVAVEPAKDGSDPELARAIEYLQAQP